MRSILKFLLSHGLFINPFHKDDISVFSPLIMEDTQYFPLSPRRERVRVRGTISPII